jgi:ligand-binding sensor domain-containing protein
MKKNVLLGSLILLLVLCACGPAVKTEVAAIESPTIPAPTSSPTKPAPAASPTEPAVKTPETPIPVKVELPKLGDSQRVEDGGFSFRVVPDYALDMNGGMVSMLAPSADPDTGPVVQLMGWKNESDKTNQQLYDELKRDTPMTVSPSSPIQVAGLAGLAADIAGDNNGKPMQGRVAMVMVNARQQFVLMFGAPQTDWEKVAPFFDAVLASVEFFELVTPPPTSSVPSGMYAYTNGNEVRGVAVYKNVAYAATIGGMVAWNLKSGYAMQYTPLQGMTHVSAYSITYCEIPEPRILVGTLSGISIYDPNTGLWEKDSLTPAESNVSGSKIDRLYCDQANNRLLIGSGGLGVLDLKTSAFQWFTQKEGLLWNAVTDITVNDKDIWVANGYNGIAKISNGKVTPFSVENGMPDKRAYSLAFSKDGTLWVGASSGIMSFKNGAWKIYGSDSPAKLNDIFEIETSADGKIWAATGIGWLCQFNPQTGACDVNFKDAGSQVILGLTFSENGSPVFGTGLGVYLFENGIARHFKTEDKLASNAVAEIVTAPDKKMWLGTGAGIYVIDPANPSEKWSSFTQNAFPTMGGKSVKAIAFGPEGTAWVAIDSGSASRYQNNAWTSFKDIYSFNTVAVDALGRAWFGDDSKGIIVLNADGSQALKLTTAEGLPSNNVQALLTDARGIVWIGTDQGLAKYENGALKVVFGKDSTTLPNKYIRALAVDADGALIIGTFTGVAIYDGSKVTTLVDFLKAGFAKARLTRLAVVPSGRLWVGTDNGLLYSDDRANWKMLTTNDGLLTNYISALHVDSYGALWVGGGGLLQIVP